ncbi:hypothetical protein D770_23870 [Flammeovirgaceae bacterium 311]|nr:hypothetical protein D770_23870 [Flammeovirgaceae bacterium 311]
MSTKAFLFAVLFINITGLTNAQSTAERPEDLKEEKITPAELKEWKIWGAGEAFAIGNQLCLKEHDETKGVMLVSPMAYGEHVVLKFKVLALTAASVVAVVISGSDPGPSVSLSIPRDYDGNFNLWYEEKENYFFAFKNAPHGLTPFVRKNHGSGEILASAPDNSMVAGLYYDVEVGRSGNKLWLTINNEEAFVAEDIAPLSGGHVSLRIRGTAGFKGACLVKDLIIYSK